MMKSQQNHIAQEDSEIPTTQGIAQKAARRNLSMLERASELNKVSKACNIMGYSRHQFYEGVNEMQQDLDEYMKYYYQEGPNQGET